MNAPEVTSQAWTWAAEIMAIAAESYQRGAVDSLLSFRDDIDEAQAGPYSTPQVLALIDVAIDEVRKVNRERPA